MIEKSDSKPFSLATAPILGQPPNHISLDAARKTAPRIRRIMAWLDPYELPIVRKQTELIRNPGLKLLAILFNHLGNGWLYPLWAGGLFFFQGSNAIPLIIVAVISLALAHLLYPKIKTYIARPRPIDRFPDLCELLQPLDLYSCPSGHSMSAAAISIPIILVIPSVTVYIVLVWFLIGWARLATGHHYPSDLIIGGLLGSIVTWPISQLYLFG